MKNTEQKYNVSRETLNLLKALRVAAKDESGKQKLAAGSLETSFFGLDAALFFTAGKCQSRV